MPTTAPPFSPTTLAELERRLHAELDRLTRVGAAGRSDLEAVAVEGDISDLLDLDEPDGGTDELARQRGRVLVALSDRGVRDVRDAIDRLHRQTYGWCGSCGDRIPLDRLRALPATTRCAPCQVAPSWSLRATA
ncbi:MAG TPA: TraR/DksA family transcriptional regulator [Acidimicrobiales bacterium]|nr:TraR/DksA family transcriptional regulator [Acidimicrobiales bacterium]